MSLTGLVDVIAWLEQVFERVGVRRSYGGAIAYNYFGPPRLTQDVDVLVAAPDSRVPALCEEFAAAGCRHGDIDPQPIDLTAVLADFRGAGRMATFLCRGVRVECFVPWHPFHHRVLDRSPERDLEGHRIRVHAPEDLIVFKKIFDRPKDLVDIKAMLVANRGALDLPRVHADAAELLTDQSLRELDDLLDAYGRSG